jgi:SAM-dependent methyltransferase
MLADVAEAWNEVAHDRLAGALQPVAEQLVERLVPREGESWLNLTTWLTAIELRVSSAGGTVTGYAGDCEDLPFDADAFGVIASAFGFIWAPDHVSVASELARVTRPDGRLGFTAWKPNPKLGELYRRFSDEPIEGREAYEWGREDHVEDMLGQDFELEFEDGTLWLEASSGEEIWKLFSESAPPVVVLLQRLDEAQAEEFHQAFVELYENYRRKDGRVRAPRRYLLVLGRRK